MDNFRAFQAGILAAAALFLSCAPVRAQFHLDTDDEAAAKLGITADEFRARVAAQKVRDAPENARILAETLKQLNDAEATRIARMRAAAKQRYEDQERSDTARLHEKQLALQRGADDEISRMNRDDAERTAQRAQQQNTERQVQQIAEQRPRPVVSVRTDPLAPAPAPSQTAESRRAAGLPDDPSAAACIQDDNCARAVLPKH
jgi:hypothetical protein